MTSIKKSIIIIILFLLVISTTAFAASPSYSLEPYLIAPNTNMVINKNQFFNFSTGVRCVDGDCGNVTASLDPENEKNLKFAPGELIVKYRGKEKFEKIEVPEDTDIINLAKEYSKLPNVDYAEPNYVFYLSQTPNDISYNLQWAHSKIQSEKGWNITTGSTNITIAVVDTGTDWNHPDLAKNIWNNTDEIIDGIDNDGNGYIDDIRGYNFVNNNNNPTDDEGHGTHCAGIASAVSNNSLGVAGLCWNCKIMALKGCDRNGYCYSDALAPAIIYAVDNGANIISMSWYADNIPVPNALKEALDYAYDSNVVLIAAAGNSNTDSINTYPQAHEHVFNVAATDSGDKKAPFSNYGNWIDVAAPGVGIYSTYYDDIYSSKSGTSMAAPHVSGLAGLVLSRLFELSNEQVYFILRTGVDEINDKTIGTGRINVFKTLKTKPIVPMNSGYPFYTINQNPVVCYNMKENDTCNQTWTINATGDINSTWDFFTIYESDLEDNITNKTKIIEITIKPSDYICVPNWTLDSNECKNDAILITYTDSNNCYNFTDLPLDNGTYMPFDCCIPNWLGLNTSCQVNDIITEYYEDSNNCFNQTGLISDTLGKPENKTYACDFCTPNWIEVNTPCQTNDEMTGYFFDDKDCYNKTGLSSDLIEKPSNITYPCDYCTPEWVLNDTWSECEQSGIQFKNYYDNKSCNETDEKPEDVNQSCEYGGLLSYGEACNYDSECYLGYCVHNICRPSSPYCGDSFCDSGEGCSSCPTDCGTCYQGGGGGYIIQLTCKENWTCTDWSLCNVGIQNRTCSDNNECGTNKTKPIEFQNCSVTQQLTANCTEDWFCNDWSECINGIQNRICIDNNKCGTLTNKSDESQDCFVTTAPKTEETLTGFFLGMAASDWAIAIIAGIVVAIVIIILAKRRSSKK